MPPDRCHLINRPPVDGALFVDDQPLNVEGAEECGIDSLWFDVANAAECWNKVAGRLDP